MGGACEATFNNIILGHICLKNIHFRDEHRCKMGANRLMRKN